MMADFYGCLETSGFHVLNDKAFLADPTIVRLQRTIKQEGGFFEKDKKWGWAFGWSGQYPDPCIEQQMDCPRHGDNDLLCDAECPDNIVSFNILDAIQRHIVPGEVCQVGVSGNEKLRYIGGGLWFVTRKGIACFDGGLVRWDSRFDRSGLRDLAHEFVADVEAIL